MYSPTRPFSGSRSDKILSGETVQDREPEKVSKEIGKALSPAEVRKALALEDTVKYGRRYKASLAITVSLSVLTVLFFLFAMWIPGDDASRWGGTGMLFFVLAAAMAGMTGWASDLRKNAVNTYLGKRETDGYGNYR